MSGVWGYMFILTTPWHEAHLGSFKIQCLDPSSRHSSLATCTRTRYEFFRTPPMVRGPFSCRRPWARCTTTTHLSRASLELGSTLGFFLGVWWLPGCCACYSDGHRLRTCFGKFNINFEPRATLDLEPKTIHLEPLIILNDISLCSIYVLTIIDRLGRWHLEPPNIHNNSCDMKELPIISSRP